MVYLGHVAALLGRDDGGVIPLPQNADGCGHQHEADDEYFDETHFGSPSLFACNG